MGCEGCKEVFRSLGEELPTGVPLVRGLFLGESKETQWVHGIDDYVFAKGFLPHW
jgi:hypothetical protein